MRPVCSPRKHWILAPYWHSSGTMETPKPGATKSRIARWLLDGEVDEGGVAVRSPVLDCDEVANPAAFSFPKGERLGGRVVEEVGLNEADIFWVGYGDSPGKRHAIALRVKIDQPAGIGDENTAASHGMEELDFARRGMAKPVDVAALRVEADDLWAVDGVELVSFCENHVFREK